MAITSNSENKESQERMSVIIANTVYRLTESEVLAHKDSLFKFDEIRKSILKYQDLSIKNPSDKHWINIEIKSLREQLDELSDKPGILNDIVQIFSENGYNKFIKYFREKYEQLDKEKTIKELKVNDVSANVLNIIEKQKGFPAYKSVDISNFEMSEEELLDYDLENFCYKDACKETGREMNKEISKENMTESHAEKIKLMKYLSKNVENFEEDFNKTVEKINNKFEEQFKKVISAIWKTGSPNSVYENGYEYSRDRSWIKWDIAKQLDYFLNKNTKNNSKYYISNPLTDELLQQEIIDRMIGWNFNTMIDLLEKAGLSGIKEISIKEKNDGGDKISSQGFTEIGELLRSYT